MYAQMTQPHVASFPGCLLEEKRQQLVTFHKFKLYTDSLVPRPSHPSICRLQY